MGGRDLYHGKDTKDKGASRADGNQRIHIGRTLKEHLKPYPEEPVPRDNDGDGQHKLYEGKGQRKFMGTHKGRQRQPKRRNHVGHGNIKFRQREDRRDDKAQAHPGKRKAAGFFLSVTGILRHNIPGRIASIGNGRADLAQATCSRVVIDAGAVGRKVNLDGFNPA